MDKKCICGICQSGCEVKVTLKDGKIDKVAPNHESKYGHLCAIGAKAKDILYSPKRVLKPLIRNGEKGTVSFREGTWEEALDLIEKNLKTIKKEHGGRSIASYMGRGTLEVALRTLGDFPFRDFGTPNDMECGSICNEASNLITPATIFGIHAQNIITDFKNADTIIIWGINPFKNNPPTAYKSIKEAKKRGAYVISIDPRKNQTAELADIWIPIKPGTDGALALGLMNILISKNMYDKDFVDNWTVGFEELKDYVKAFDLETVEKICGVDKNIIIHLAEKIAVNIKTALSFYTGLEYAPSGIQNMRSLYILMAITGNMDNEGGFYIDNYPVDGIKEKGVLKEHMPIGADKYPLYYALTGKGQFSEFPKTVIDKNPYDVEALIIIGGSPIVSYPSTQLWAKAYEQLKFLVVIDRFMPEEAKWADVILPVTTHYERASFQRYKDKISLRSQVIEPLGEAKEDLWILHQIAKRLGYESRFPKNLDDILDMTFKDDKDTISALKETGYIKIEKKRVVYKKYEKGLLRKDGKLGFPTESGKFEISSCLLKKHGYDELPIYIDPYESVKDKMKEYPLTLTTGARGLVRENSQYIEIPELIKYEKEPLLEINSEDAEKRGIKSEDKVWLLTGNGKVQFKALVTEKVGKGVIHVPHGGGKYTQNENWRDSNVNSIINIEDRDPISGFVVLKSLCCQVKKA